MSHNVHGHSMPEPFRVNEDNPIFQRHQPEVIPAEVPAGLHGAPALRSELESPVETVQPETSPAPEVPVEQSPSEIPTDPNPSAADLDAVVEEQEIAKKTRGKKGTTDPDGEE